MKRLWLISTIFTCLALAWVFSRLAEPHFCIDSKVVQRIVITATGNEFTVNSCHALSFLEDHSIPSGELSQQINNWIQRIEDMDELFLSLSPQFAQPLTLRVSLSRPLTYRQDLGWISLGADIVNAEGALEFLVLKNWLKNSPQNNFVLSVLTGLLQRENKSNQNIVDPVTGESQRVHSSKPVFWPSFLTTVGSYCDSHWRALEHIKSCRKKDSVSPVNSLNPWSLKPIIHHALWNYRKNLSLREHLIWNKNLRDYLLKGPALKGWRPISAKGSVAYKTIRSHVKSLLIELLSALTPHSQKQLDKYVENYLGPPQKIKADLLIISRLSEDTPRMNLSLVRFAKENPETKMVFRAQNQLRLLPGWETGLEISFEDIDPHRVLVFSCQIPSAKDLLALRSHAEEVTVIKKCQDGQLNVDLKQLLKTSPEKMAQWNDKFNFLRIHLPSLKLAYRLGGDNLEDPTKWAPWLGWENPQKDSSSVVHRPRAVIMALKSYRWLN